MYELIELFETQPQVRKVNMEFKNIRDLTPLVAILAKFKNLAELSLHGNKITSVPALDSIRNLKAIDLSNNPLKVDKHLLDRLHHLPRLEDLYIDCSREEREAIIENAPNLKTLNGELIVRQLYMRQTREEQLRGLEARLSDEMKKMKETYNRLAASLGHSDSDAPAELRSPRPRDEELKLEYRDIQEEMGYFYSGLQDQLSREGVFAYCKNKLTAVLDNLMVKILDEHASESVVKIYEEVSRIKSENFDFLLRIIFNASYERHLNEQLERPDNRLRKETLYQNEIFRLKKELLQLRQETQKLNLMAQKDNSHPALKNTKKSPRNIERTLSAAKLPKHSPSAKLPKHSPSAKLPKHSPSAKTLPRITTLSPNHSPTLTRTPSAAAGKGGGVRGGRGKILSQQQLVRLVEEIMSEKRKYNLRSLGKNECFETAEEFLFTFFTRKYGLKEVALEWSLSVIKAIEQYCKESIEVEVFGKILKNSLYEEYYDEFRQFGKDIEKVYRESKVDRSCIHETTFRRIFFYFFSYENEETFQKIIPTFTFPLRAAELTYFLHSYKLAFEEKHLAPFLHLFANADSDDDSALSAKQTKELLLALIRLSKDLSEQAVAAKMEEYAAVVDSFKKSKFIFSEVFQIAHKLL